MKVTPMQRVLLSALIGGFVCLCVGCPTGVPRPLASTESAEKSPSSADTGRAKALEIRKGVLAISPLIQLRISLV